MQSVTFFKALSDPTRLRMIHLLTQRDELCVCHFTEVLGLPQSSVSRHLTTLRHAGLVSGRKEGVWVHYRLSVDDDSPFSALVREIAALGEVEPILAGDISRLAQARC